MSFQFFPIDTQFEFQLDLPSELISPLTDSPDLSPSSSDQSIDKKTKRKETIRKSEQVYHNKLNGTNSKIET